MSRLLEQYKNEIQPELRDSLGVKNPMAIPRLTKVVVSMGTGSPSQDMPTKRPSASARPAPSRPGPCPRRESNPHLERF